MSGIGIITAPYARIQKDEGEILSLTAEQREQLQCDHDKVDVYTRTDPQMPYTLVFSNVSKCMLQAFSQHAAVHIAYRTGLSPKTDGRLNRAFRSPDQKFSDNSRYVWVIDGFPAVPLDALIRWMRNTCNKDYNPEPVRTANVKSKPGQHMTARDWITTIYATFALDIPTARQKMLRQFSEDYLQLGTWEMALEAFDASVRFNFDGVITGHLRQTVRAVVLQGRGIRVEQLGALCQSAADADVKKFAAKQVGIRLVVWQGRWFDTAEAQAFSMLPEHIQGAVTESVRKERIRRYGPDN